MHTTLHTCAYVQGHIYIQGYSTQRNIHTYIIIQLKNKCMKKERKRERGGGEGERDLKEVLWPDGFRKAQGLNDFH